MKKIVVLFLTCLAMVSCEIEEETGTVETPSNISNVTAQPRVGGVLVKWDVPADSSFTYVELRYKKNGKPVLEQISKYTDSLLVEDLINAEEFVFELQTVNEIPNAIAKGKIFTTQPVRPIAREPEITYFPDDLTPVQIEITANMLDTYTQEVSEGPKENLIDGDPATYWHSAWSSNTAPLPHWIQINFEEPQELGAIKYWLRNPASSGGMPTQLALATSADGVTWERVWESVDNLSIDNAVEHTVAFDINYEAKHFRVLILQNAGGTTFTHLGEITFYTMASDIVDKEKEAEEEYYNY